MLIFARIADVLDVVMIGAAAAAEDIETGRFAHQSKILRGQFTRITRVTLLSLIKFSMALGGCVGPDTPDSL